MDVGRVSELRSFNRGMCGGGGSPTRRRNGPVAGRAVVDVSADNGSSEGVETEGLSAAKTPVITSINKLVGVRGAELQPHVGVVHHVDAVSKDSQHNHSSDGWRDVQETGVGSEV